MRGRYTKRPADGPPKVDERARVVGHGFLASSSRRTALACYGGDGVEIVFVRHGQPAWAREGRPDMDPELTELGREQAIRVAARLAERGAEEVLVSPAKRARETATPIEARLGKRAVVTDDLVEIRLPDWSKLTLPEVAAQFTNARSRHPEEWWQGMPGGEAFRDFRVRVEKCLYALLEARGIHRSSKLGAPHFEAREKRGRIVVVAHGGTNAVALAVLVGIPSVPWEWERFALGHASILRLKLVEVGRDHVFSLRAHNDCEHLPRELRST